MFPADVRIRLAREGLSHLDNVLVHPTDGYLVSAATFPSYFMKPETDVPMVAGLLDLTVFCKCLAPALHISVRFVGEEPRSLITAAYNAQMKTILPAHGIRVREIPRLQSSEGIVSASEVRRLLSANRLEEVATVVPECTMRFLQSPSGRNCIAFSQKHVDS